MISFFIRLHVLKASLKHDLFITAFDYFYKYDIAWDTKAWLKYDYNMIILF